MLYWYLTCYDSTFSKAATVAESALGEGLGSATISRRIGSAACCCWAPWGAGGGHAIRARCRGVCSIFSCFVFVDTWRSLDRPHVSLELCFLDSYLQVIMTSRGGPDIADPSQAFGSYVLIESSVPIDMFAFLLRLVFASLVFVCVCAAWLFAIFVLV